MKKFLIKSGCRSSKLSLIQSENTVKRIQDDLKNIKIKLIGLKTLGDLNHNIALEDKSAPEDIFTRELDLGLKNGDYDIVIHSAKDLPPKGIEGIDFFWLPWRESPGDVLIFRKGETFENLKNSPIAGVSSDRRVAYIKSKFPNAQCKSIRGTIDERIKQLDDGEFDIILMAEAALNRLHLTDRISYKIPSHELLVPDGQGYIAITYLKDNPIGLMLRDLYTKPLSFIGAGPGDPELMTIKGQKEIEKADCILYDALVNKEILNMANNSAEKVFVGKRAGQHSMHQNEITKLMIQKIKEGKRVVRLKGGDPAIFGRLKEEIAGLIENKMPYKIIPGISALNGVSTAGGLLLTSRGINQSFITATATTETIQNNKLTQIAKSKLPAILFMGFNRILDIRDEFLESDWPAKTSIAIINSHNGTQVLHSTLEKIEKDLAQSNINSPAIIAIGEFASAENSISSPKQILSGQKVLLPGEKNTIKQMKNTIEDYGGTAISWSLIKLTLEENALKNLPQILNSDFIILTSPSSVDLFFEAIPNLEELRLSKPKFILTGPSTSSHLKQYGYTPYIMPEQDYSSDGIIKALDLLKINEKKFVFPRSDIGGKKIEEYIKKLGGITHAFTLYNNEIIKPVEDLPSFDCVLFSSPSSIKNFLSNYTKSALDNKIIGCIGSVTEKCALQEDLKVHIKPKHYNAKELVNAYVHFLQNKNFIKRAENI